MHVCPNCTFMVRQDTEQCPSCGFSFSMAPALNLEDEQTYRSVLASSTLKNAMAMEKIRRWVTIIGICTLVTVLAILVMLILIVSTF